MMGQSVKEEHLRKTVRVRKGKDLTPKRLGFLCGSTIFYCMNLGGSNCSEPHILIRKVNIIIDGKHRKVINVKCLVK